MTGAPITSAAIDQLCAPFGSSRSLPGEAYISGELFAWEQTWLFGASWPCAARTADLTEPGANALLPHARNRRKFFNPSKPYRAGASGSLAVYGAEQPCAQTDLQIPAAGIVDDELVDARQHGFTDRVVR
jgi:hypothetical protein